MEQEEENYGQNYLPDGDGQSSDAYGEPIGLDYGSVPASQDGYDTGQVGYGNSLDSNYAQQEGYGQQENQGQYADQWQGNYPDPLDRPKKTARKFILVVVLVIVILIAAILAVSMLYGREAATPADSVIRGMDAAGVQDPARLTAEKSGRPELGNPGAGLVIVEFADFQCHNCQAEFPIIRQAVLSHKDSVRYIFRNYPVIDDNSSVLAKAGFCANDQGRFWQFHDRLYSIQGSLTANVVNDLARLSGIDLSAFSICLTSGKFDNMLREDILDAGALGVVGTPTFFINGNKLEGVVTAADWERIIAEFGRISQK